MDRQKKVLTETSDLRSRTMRAVRSRDTGPELAVRKLLRVLGFTGYRLHLKSLPGTVDIAFVGLKKAIFVNGCFWHGHHCRRGDRLPVNNAAYWQNKIDRNRSRDVMNLAELERCGWATLTIWECELRDLIILSGRLKAFMLK